ncbi:alpha/beta hydrolase [Bacillus sp. HMF5848]|uniref:alpha/beta fold hydrolase n=1 Tax=Bacillus sp. HMF5848 TaxID=2495421 RepID=UPI000F77E04E|nr:alpha/beta hydrolase [Bacillus sp. HMF5848]RSK26626.1 alpha/beta hydrolase [Bacillus sp. HMF5848]
MEKGNIPYLRLGFGEPLVLIHGLGEVKEGWHNQFELADQYDMIIPDLRGHGDCENQEDISIEIFAEDIITLLKNLNIENANICGLSMGGAVAQEIYRQAPHMCRSLILVSTFHYFPKQFGKLFYKFREHKAHSLSRKKQKNYAAHISLYSWDDNTVHEFNHYFRPKPDAFLNSLKACLKVNNLSLLPKITAPTLIVGSQYDSVLPVWIQLWMHKLIPHSEFVILRNSGHVAKVEAKHSFNGLLRNFLGKQKATA